MTAHIAVPVDKRVLILDAAQARALHALARAGAYYSTASFGRQLTSTETELLTAIATCASLPQPQRQPRQPHNPNMLDSWATATQIAAHTGYSLRTVQRHAKTWGAVKHKGAWKYPPHLLEQ
ncbi:hypothetical protein CIP107577_01962 [Corynebacterium diphtheriae]|nr:hypothetical protein CIP107577_01962 [Corynebacterium diphtheriae]